LAANADVFFIEGVGYGEFRRPAVTTTEAATGSIKAEQRRPREGEAKKKKNRGRQRKEAHKTETNTSSKPRKPINIIVFSIAPCKPENGRTQAASRDLHHHLNKRKTERGRSYTDKSKITVLQASSQSPKAGKRKNPSSKP